MTVRYRFGVAVIAWLWLFAAGPTAAAAAPRMVIDDFHAALLQVWQQAATLTAVERVERLDAPVRATFDAAAMMRTAAGSAWREAAADERERLAEAFFRYTVATYASRFTGHAGQSFRTSGERAGADGQQVIETAIVRADGSTVSLDYVVHPVDGGWKVIDVIAEGVSEVAVLRSDYRQTLRNGGTAALIDALTALTDKLLGR